MPKAKWIGGVACLCALLGLGDGIAQGHAVPRRVGVPRVLKADVASAYNTLRGVGLRVTITTDFVVDDALGYTPDVRRASPRAGKIVEVGSTVTLGLGPCACGVSSPALPLGKLPTYIMPSFVGKTSNHVVAWATGKLVAVDMHFGVMRNGAAATLYKNYVITRQKPAAGSHVALGIKGGGTETGGVATGSFTETRLLVWAAQVPNEYAAVAAIVRHGTPRSISAPFGKPVAAFLAMIAGAVPRW